MAGIISDLVGQQIKALEDFQATYGEGATALTELHASLRVLAEELASLDEHQVPQALREQMRATEEIERLVTSGNTVEAVAAIAELRYAMEAVAERLPLSSLKRDPSNDNHT